MEPQDRQSFIEYCLRRLGKPVVEINVDEDQVSDRVDDALRYYWDYHFDGTEKVYYKHMVTEVDRTNKYIILPPNIIGAVNIFSIGDPSVRADDLFNIRYQIALNDLYTLTSVSMIPYYMVMEHLALVTEFLVGKQPIRYNRHTNKLYVDMDWDNVADNEFLLVEAYSVLDPNQYTDMWKDRWLKQYATVLIKEQWGTNTKKFSGIQTLGGVTFNGQQIYNEAVQERLGLEKSMIEDFSLPVMDMVS